MLCNIGKRKQRNFESGGVEFANKTRGYAERMTGCVKSGSNGNRNENDWNRNENDCAKKTRN